MDTLESRFCREQPSQQTALDIFKGAWKSSLPEKFGLIAGDEPAFFLDTRVHWARAALSGGFDGLDILEIGPFEGYASYLFTTMGASKVTAVESSNINFLKCLLLKDTLGLDIKLLHGDCVEHLAANETRHDLIWASGILYHSERPLRLLELMASRTDRVFIWTHVFTSALLQNENQGFFHPAQNVAEALGSESFQLHYRSYHLDGSGTIPVHYEGGTQGYAYWLSQQDLERALGLLGFNSIRVHKAGEFSGMAYVGLLAERV